MKSILVPVEDHDRTSSILATTLTFARLFSSRICGFALVPSTTPFLAADVVGASLIYEPLAEFDEEKAANAKALFESFMRSHGLPETPTGEERPSWTWKANVPQGDFVVGSLARVYDVTVLGRPEPRMSGPRPATLDAALFDSGRPVLIAPPEPVTTIGKTIVIAWNRSTETAVTVAHAMPLLKRASEIVVLSVDTSMVAGPAGEDLAAYLREYGLPVRVQNAEAGKRSAGEAILEEASRLGCDLLIKGAFTQSRLRQIIFGGATRHIIEQTTLPVLMAH